MRRMVVALTVMAMCCGRAIAETIHVAAAISLKEALTEEATAFQKKTGDVAELRFGSSGDLLAQIRNGAPTDVFVSAANKQMDDLSDLQLIDRATRRVVASNELVLTVPASGGGGGAKEVPKDFKELTQGAYARIAVGEPRTVPAGQYAVALLKHLGIYDALKPRLVYGANVRQVLVYVERGEVNAGIVYSTDAQEAGDRVKVAAIAKASDHPPIDYPAAVIAGSGHKEAAEKFIQFLASDDGQKILAAHGFVPPAPAGTTTKAP